MRATENSEDHPTLLQFLQLLPVAVPHTMRMIILIPTTIQMSRSILVEIPPVTTVTTTVTTITNSTTIAVELVLLADPRMTMILLPIGLLMTAVIKTVVAVPSL